MSNAITTFENQYGNIPDQISCGNATLHSPAVKSVVAPNKWVDGTAISALLDLIDIESTVTFDASFITLFRRAKHHEVIQSASDFFENQDSLLDNQGCSCTLPSFHFSMRSILEMEIIGYCLF